MIGALLVTVWLTSIFHWYKPRFSTIIRRLDFAAVFTALGYGSYFSSKLREQYFLAWIVGIGIVAVIFIGNESMYYLRISKNPAGEDIITESEWSTAAGSQRREVRVLLYSCFLPRASSNASICLWPRVHTGNVQLCTVSACIVSRTA